MPGPTQRTMAAIAVLTGSLPLAVGAVVAAARGELPGAAATAGVALLIAAPLAIRDGRWFRAVCLVVGLPMLGLRTAALALGGILGMPVARPRHCGSHPGALAAVEGGVTSFRSTGDGYEWEFERGATEERDRVAARLRDRAGVESVRTRDERCG